jgi:hypothetical protein
MDIGQILGKIVEGKITFGLRFGVITARTNTNTRVSLTLSGSTTAITGIRYLASYTPTVSDVVVCLVNDNDVIVIGKLV